MANQNIQILASLPEKDRNLWTGVSFNLEYMQAANDNRQMLEKSIFEALKVYSNVHRGSGHKSIVSTALFEQARRLVLDYLGVDPRKYRVVFCTPYQAELLEKKLRPGSYQIISSASFGLSIGVRAVVARKGNFPAGAPPMSGGGTAKLISTGWVIWAGTPARFEAGTPAVINVISFVRALQLAKDHGEDLFTGHIKKNTALKELFPTDQVEGLKGEELLRRFRSTRIGLGLQVPTKQGPKNFINFDSSASTPTFGPIWDTFRKSLFLTQSAGNLVLKEVREICSDFLGAPLKDYEIIFTGNTTEGINLVAGSLAVATAGTYQPVVVGTLMEHSSNDLPWRNLPNHTLIRIPVDLDGILDVQRLTELLEDYNKKGKYGNQRIRLVALSAASNVLGTCNHLEEISRLVHNYQAELLVDGAQMVAHRKVDIAKSEFDYFVFSAHKVYAPFGSGALVVRKGLLNYTAEDTGRILASGCENLAGIGAMGMALTLLGRIGMERIGLEEQELTAQTLRGMHQVPGMKLVGLRDYEGGKLAQRVGVIPFNLEKMVSFTVGRKLAFQSGIGVRVGCHCAHILVKHVLGVKPGLERFQRIMQTLIPSVSFPGVVRVSLGIENTKEDVEVLLEGLKQISTGSSSGTKKNSRKEVNRIFSDYAAEWEEKVFGSPA